MFIDFLLIFEREREREREKDESVPSFRGPRDQSNPQPLVHRLKLQPREPPSQGVKVFFRVLLLYRNMRSS